MTVSYQTVLETPFSMVLYSANNPTLDPDVAPVLIAEGQNGGTTYYQTFDHHVTLGNLEPDTTYYYSISGSDDPEGEDKSSVLTFNSAPLSESVEVTTFAFFGDLGLVNGDSTREYLASITEGDKPEIDLIFHAGDVGYADDSTYKAKLKVARSSRPRVQSSLKHRC